MDPKLIDGHNALLVPPGDDEALAEAIRRLASDQGLHATLAAGARELARHFSWGRIAAMHAQLYSEI